MCICPANTMHQHCALFRTLFAQRAQRRILISAEGKVRPSVKRHTVSRDGLTVRTFGLFPFQFSEVVVELSIYNCTFSRTLASGKDHCNVGHAVDRFVSAVKRPSSDTPCPLAIFRASSNIGGSDRKCA